MGALNSLRNWYTSVFTTKSAQDLNPSFKDFSELDKEDEDNLRKSVISQAFNTPDPNYGGQAVGYDVNSAYTNFIYGSVSTSKGPRLLNYRSMAGFPEISDAIDEICDSTLNYDDDGNIITLNIKNKDIDQSKESVLNDEFRDFIDLFDFEHNFYDYIRTLIIDGQLAWENIVDTEKKEDGIIGINPVPTESYDFLIDDNGVKRGLNVKSMPNENTSNTSTVQQGLSLIHI